MKKILFVIPTMRMGGAEQSLVSLLNSIDLNIYEIDVLLFEKNGELLERIPEKINLIEADRITRAMTLEFRYYFKDLINEHHYFTAVVRTFMLINSKLEELIGKKIVFNWNIAKHFTRRLSKEYDVAIGYLEGVTDAFVIDKVKAKRKIGWIHTNFDKANRHFKAEGKYYKQFNRIAIISDECKNSFVKYYPDLSDKICVIENIIDKNTILNKAQENIEESLRWIWPCIVTVGRLEKVKGIDIALEAARVLKEEGMDFVWHVFGDGVLKAELERKMHDYGLENNFFINGTTHNPYKYMKNADVIVQSSRNEGKSIVLDEAKLLCKPIVVTNYPSARDQIKDGETGMIVGMEPKSIAEGIIKLIRDPKQRKYLEEQCKKEINNTELIMEKIVSVIEGD